MKNAVSSLSSALEGAIAETRNRLQALNKKHEELADKMDELVDRIKETNDALIAYENALAVARGGENK